MGCSHTKKSELLPEEFLINQTVSSFNFNKFSCNQLIENLYPSLEFQQVPYKVIKKVIPNSNLNQPSQHFLKDLTKSQVCSSKKMKTLLILVSKSSISEKILSIFNIYAEATIETLLVSEAELLISQIIQIHLQYIPEYVQKIYQDHDKIEDFRKYCMKLSLFNNFLLRRFMKKLFRREFEIQRHEFVCKMLNSEELLLLLKGSKLRSYCVDFFMESLISTPDSTILANIQLANNEDQLLQSNLSTPSNKLTIT